LSGLEHICKRRRDCRVSRSSNAVSKSNAVVLIREGAFTPPWPLYGRRERERRGGRRRVRLRFDECVMVCLFVGRWMHLLTYSLDIMSFTFSHLYVHFQKNELNVWCDVCSNRIGGV